MQVGRNVMKRKEHTSDSTRKDLGRCHWLQWLSYRAHHSRKHWFLINRLEGLHTILKEAGRVVRPRINPP